MFDTNITINLGGEIIDFSQPRVMAIINVTDNSFYAGSRNRTDSELIETTQKALSQGADILDIGAVSTRPGSTPPSPEEEIQTLSNALNTIRQLNSSIPLSIDTYRSQVVEALHQQFGPLIINDISGGTLDSQMLQTAARLNLPYIMGHIKGSPQTMNNNAQYDDLMNEIIQFFVQQINKARQLGLKDILIDPCFGFAKNTEQNFSLLKHYPQLQLFSLPIVASLSRKSLIFKTLNTTPDNALTGTIALNWQALTNGAKLLRVHDVEPARQIITLFQTLELAK